MNHRITNLIVAAAAVVIFAWYIGAPALRLACSMVSAGEVTR